MSDGKTKLSIEEFLAINENYNTYKAKVKKSERRNNAIGVTMFIASFIISAVAFWITVDIILALILFFAAMIPSIVFLSSNENKTKQKLEKYGADLYREYLEENNYI